VTIPKTLVQILGWEDKDEIEFGFEDGKITLSRVKKK
jgi:antitoxin component of MazEF toxin-antitoxin module